MFVGFREESIRESPRFVIVHIDFPAVAVWVYNLERRDPRVTTITHWVLDISVGCPDVVRGRAF
jgi:hypothetical protein